MSSGKPRKGIARGKPRALPDLRSARVKKFRAVKRKAAKVERDRKLERRVGVEGKERLDELWRTVRNAIDSIKAHPDLDDLSLKPYKHVNADGTIDVELRISDLPSYQDPDAALAIISEALPDTFGAGDVFISHGARFTVSEPEIEIDPATGEEIIRGIDEIKKAYKGAHGGRLQEQTYWRDASIGAKKVGSQVGGERMLRAFADRDRKVDTVFVRYHWSPERIS